MSKYVDRKLCLTYFMSAKNNSDIKLSKYVHRKCLTYFMSAENNSDIKLCQNTSIENM